MTSSQSVPAACATQELTPSDIESMRAVAAEWLARDTQLPRCEELVDMSGRLRRHLLTLLPVVEQATRTLPMGNPVRVAALLTVENARVRLTASPGNGLVSSTQHTRSLARELSSLCDHHQILTARTAGEPM